MRTYDLSPFWRSSVGFDRLFDLVNNATNEQALLALDRERGLLARVGYLVNQPRTFGLTTRAFF